MGNVNTLTARMRYWCAVANLGYSQDERWDIRDGGNCDCSSLVIHCLREAGFDTGSASYTGDMSANLTARGWRRLPADGNPQPGDILLNDVHHTAVCLGGGLLAQASYSEHHSAHGAGGDQTGHETNVSRYYNYPWDCYLRYGAGSGTAAGQLAVDGSCGPATVRRWQAVMGTPVDGVISGQVPPSGGWGRPALSAYSYGRGGSMLVRAVQRRLGVAVDGLLGPATIRAIQTHLGVNADGWFGPGTVRALQSRLNQGTF